MDESAEHQRIVKLLGCEPNPVEKGIFSVMWSEHCCYKSSKMYLKNLPTKGEHVLQGPGENAGIIDIGDGLAIAFKIESHNHPSFIEPYQGAATGVGGILRDIFTMGARPIASLNSLHFGDISHPRTPYLLRGVVAGIGGYGNCMGIPTVGGETHFDECYNGNILVNAFTLGVLKKDKIFRGLAAGIGNPVILVGSKTGRDGIHGAKMASEVFDNESESKRPTVQVGDPFTEKKLMEACLEAFQLEDAILGIQDMGAAGFTCSSFEMSERGNVGMELWLDKIPLREEKMTPYEIMLSESQERMLLVAEKNAVEKLKRIFEKWELEFAVVGKVISEKRVRGFFHKELAFDLPVDPVTKEAPIYERPLEEIPSSKIQMQKKMELPELLSSPNICSKKWIWRQYDQSVGTNTAVGPGADAAVIRVKENDRLLAMTLDSQSRRCRQDPYWGAIYTVAEALRNLTCVGAKPLGITDCLNFGNPQNPQVMWQFKEVCRGLTTACKKFGIPITGGNVSFYNETEGKNIDPTPTIGMVGILPKGMEAVTPWWKNAGDCIYCVGDFSRSVDGKSVEIDLDEELAKNNLLHEAFAQKLIASAHDVSLGGLAVALARSSFLPDEKNLGATVNFEGDLYGEEKFPYIVSLALQNEKQFLDLARRCRVTVKLLGNVGGEKLKINGTVDANLNILRKNWNEGLQKCAGL